MRFFLVFSALVCLSLIPFLASCGSSGSSLGVGELLPPVSASVPTTLSSGSAAVSSRAVVHRSGREVSQLTTIKERFFTSGPTDFMNRVKPVHDRLKSLSGRNVETARTCVSEAAQAWEITGMPDKDGTMTGTFTMYFSCSETVSDNLTLYFGKKDGYSYVAELQIDDTGETPTIAVLGKVDDNSTVSEVWQIIINSADKVNGDNSKKRSAWLYVKGNSTTKTFEMASGATGTLATSPNEVEPFTGVGCGVRMNINETHVYTVGLYTDFNQSAGGDCSAADVPVCATATDLEDATTACDGVLDTFSDSTPALTWESLSTAVGGVERGYTKALAIISGTGIPTLTDFNTSAGEGN